jgi:adenine C2-methylase RlmN of 23S rRNA A2503 and tRNA A37
MMRWKHSLINVLFMPHCAHSGLAATVRTTRGLEAAAACGQLRNQHQKVPLAEFAALS